MWFTHLLNQLLGLSTASLVQTYKAVGLALRDELNLILLDRLNEKLSFEWSG